MDHLYVVVIILPQSTVSKSVYSNDNKIMEFELIHTKISSIAYVAIY